MLGAETVGMMTVQIKEHSHISSNQIDDFLVWLTVLNNRSPRTAQTYKSFITGFLHYLDADPSRVTSRGTIESYLIVKAAGGMSPSGRRTAVCALRAWFNFLIATEQAEDNPALLVATPKVPRVAANDYSPHELEQLLQAPLDAAAAAKADGEKSRWLRARADHALIATYRYTGARQSELLQANTTQLDLNRQLIAINGKGSKQRVVPLPQPLVTILDDYLATIRPACPPSKLLFANPSGYAGTAAYGTYTARACLNLIVRYGTQAGIEGRHHPHRIRHAYATDMLRRGISLEVLRQLLGHESLAITQRYLHLRSDDLSDAVNRVFAL